MHAMEVVDGTRVNLTSEHELASLTCKQLRRLCRDRALKMKGLKCDLVGRLARHEKRLERAERKAAQEEEEEKAAELTSSDRFAAALNDDDADDTALEDIFNIEMPQPGEVVTGVVISLVDWGAFVELDETGWSGLLHVSEIADEFIDNIEDYLHPGQRVECLVIRNQNDRLDRLSLSIRRLKGREQETQGGTVIGQQEASKALTPKGRKIDSIEDSMSRLEVRLSAIEAVLSQLGHGQALRSAQEEAYDGSIMPSVPPMDMLLSGIPDPGKERRRSRSDSEKDQIDAILEDLRAETAGKK